MSSNPSDKNNRNLWNKPKERDRMKARYIIKEYLLNLPNNTINEIKIPTNKAIEVLKPFIKAIEEGKIQYFGIHKLVSTLLLPNIINIPIINMQSINTERLKLVSRSIFSTDYYENLKLYLEQKSVSLVSYAAYLGEYSIVAMLLISLADPSSSSDLFTESYSNSKERKTRNKINTLQTFCKTSFPLSLYCGIVRRVNEMRLFGCVTQSACPLCNSNDTLLCYCTKSKMRLNHEESEECNCNHFFCENCLWEDILKNYSYRHDGDVVICPVCSQNNDTISTMNRNAPFPSTLDKEISPQKRKLQSYENFKSLPNQSIELKNSTTHGSKKKKNVISYSWKQSIQLHQMGQSKDVRIDKFYHYTHLGSYHYLQNILEHGVDVDFMDGEYNQTCLMIATWYGYTDIVSLLLYYGANPYVSNGALPLDIAKRYNYKDVMSLLDYYCNTHETITIPKIILKDTISSYDNKPILKYLIDPNENHPSKGSCIIDNILPNDMLHNIDSLFHLLSTYSTPKDKNNSDNCADRYYYCDVQGHVCSILSQSILQAFTQKQDNDCNTKEVIVFPHVRFLNYTRQNTFLAPHVDLFRTFDLFPVQHYITTNDDKSTCNEKYSNKSSTHTFILYLTNCDNGGSTSLLSSLPTSSNSEYDVLAKVQPKQGRLLLFPHLCPHCGDVVVDVPKLLIRGEVYID